MGRYWPDAQTTTQKHYFYVIFFSSFTQQWEQNANLQPASLWSIKWWRWSICGHIAICLNLINSTEEATVYCWRLVNKWKSSSGSSLWWTYDSSLRIMIRYGHFWKRRSFFFLPLSTTLCLREWQDTKKKRCRHVMSMVCWWYTALLLQKHCIQHCLLIW